MGESLAEGEKEDIGGRKREGEDREKEDTVGKSPRRGVGWGGVTLFNLVSLKSS